MKRLGLLLFSSLLLVACSAGEEPAEQEEVEQQEEAGVEVDKGLLNVEITLPEMFFDEEDLTEIEKEMEENHQANVTKNDDGSITVKMSKKEHKQLLEEMSEELMEMIDEVIADEEYPSIEDISYNRDFTEINVVVNREQFEENLDAFALFSVAFSSLFYQLFDGKDIEKEKVVMNMIDEATEESFDEIVYPDVFDEIDDMVEE